MSQVSREDVFVAIDPSPHDDLAPVVIGAVVAGACADALGWVTEFMRSPSALQHHLGVERLTDYVSWRKKVGGRFNTYLDFIGPGEYSDDTQLTLSVARALRSDASVDHNYFGKTELASWLDYSRGAGRTITAAAKAVSRSRSTWDNNFFVQGKLDYRSSGANGAAMRISPIALASVGNAAPPLTAVFENAITTHGHPRAHVGAVAYAAALWETVRRRNDPGGGPRLFLDAVLEWIREWSPARAGSSSVEEWIAHWNSLGGSYEREYDATVTEFEEMMRIVGKADHRAVLESLGCFSPATKGSGTATVAAALHLFCWHGKDVERSITEAVNAIPGDTDTIGAVVGTLAGAYAGYGEIPERWTYRLQDLPYIVSVGDALARIGCGIADTPVPLRPRSRTDELPDVMELLRSGRIEREMRVRHHVLGPGWVQGIHAQQIRRRDGGEMIYARVQLDIGQTCQFRAHLPDRRRSDAHVDEPRRIA